MDVRHIIDDASHLAEQPQREWFIEMFIALIVMAALMAYIDNRKPKPKVMHRRRRHIETGTIFKAIFGTILFAGCIALATYYMGVWQLPEMRPSDDAHRHKTLQKPIPPQY